ncbi:MAG TPA: hypothetical protein VHB21_12240 [Minicystis sp.]|nr:hypothetical protein [Minicystis sp.]
MTRTKTLVGLAFGFLFAATTLTASRTVQAEDEYDVAAHGGTITVTTKGPWHINKDYPWKVVQQGDTKLDKSKFSLDEKSAKVTGAPKGKVTVKGAVCSGDSCKTFAKDVTVD